MMSAIEGSDSAELEKQVQRSGAAKSPFAELYLAASSAERRTIRDSWVTRCALEHVMTLSADGPTAFARQASLAVWLT